MKAGDILKEKKEYLLEKFQTKYGLLNFFVGTAIWWAVIINYIDPAYEYFFELYKVVVGYEYVAMYFAFLSIGFVFSLVGYAVTYAIVRVYDEFFGGF